MNNIIKLLEKEFNRKFNIDDFNFISDTGLCITYDNKKFDCRLKVYDNFIIVHHDRIIKHKTFKSYVYQTRTRIEIKE